MNMTPCLWLFSAISASSVPPAETLLKEIAANSRMHTGSCRAFAAQAARVMDVWREAGKPVVPVPPREHPLAVALMRAFPGISASESTVVRHILDNPDMSMREQEELTELLGEPCPIMDYFNLSQSLIGGLAAEGPDAPYAPAAREVIVANALRDVQRQPHLVAMLVHVQLLRSLHENGWLRHIKADEHLARITKLAQATRPEPGKPFDDIRTQIVQAEPLRDALLVFLLAEASA